MILNGTSLNSEFIERILDILREKFFKSGDKFSEAIWHVFYSLINVCKIEFLKYSTNQKTSFLLESGSFEIPDRSMLKTSGLSPKLLNVCMAVLEDFGFVKVFSLPNKPRTQRYLLQIPDTLIEACEDHSLMKEWCKTKLKEMYEKIFMIFNHKREKTVKENYREDPYQMLIFDLIKK